MALGEAHQLDHIDRIIWPETPLGVKVKEKKHRIKLNSSSLRELADRMDTATENGIGTFHLPTWANRKVKFDRDYGEHVIWWT